MQETRRFEILKGEVVQLSQPEPNDQRDGMVMLRVREAVIRPDGELIKTSGGSKSISIWCEKDSVAGLTLGTAATIVVEVQVPGVSQ